MWLPKFIPQPCFDNAGAGGEGSSGAGPGVGSGDRGYGGFGESAGYGGGGQVGGVSEGIGGGGIGAFGSGAGSGSGGGFTPGQMSYSGGTQNYGPSQTRSPDMVSGAQAGTGLLGSGDRGYGGFGEGVGGYSDRGNQNAAGAGASGQAGVGGLGSGEGSGPNGAQAAAAAAAAGRGSLAASSPSRNPVTTQPLPAPVKTPTVIAPPPKVVAPPPTVVAPPKPTIAAPTTAQLQALNTMKTVAPVTAANASVYGPAAMMSVPTSAPTMAAAVDAVAAQVANKASTAAPNTGNTPVGALGTPGGISGGAMTSRGLAETAASIGTGTPGGISGGSMAANGLGPSSGSPSGGRGDFGGGMLGSMADAPSNYGGAAGNFGTSPAATSGWGGSSPGGNAVVGQSRANAISGQEDPSTNATGYSAAPGLESRLGMLNSQLNNNAAMQTMEAFGVPTLASSPQATLARGQFMAENQPSTTRPTAEVTVNTGTLTNPTQTPNTAAKRDLEAPNTAFSVHSKTPMDDALSSTHGIQQQPNRPAKRDLEQPVVTQLTPETLAAASAFNEAVKAAQRNPYGTPAQRDTNAQLAAYGQTNQTISAPGMTSPTGRASLAGLLSSPPSNPYGTPAQRDTNAQQAAYGLLDAAAMAEQMAQERRAAQAQASTNAIRQGLLTQQAQPASAPTNEEMPGSTRASIGPDFGIVRPALRALFGEDTDRAQRAFEAFRKDQQAALGGSATDGQGNPSTDPAANAAQDAVDQADDAGTFENPIINKASGLKRAGTRTMSNVNALVVHHTGGRGDVNGVIKTLNSRRLGVQFVVDRNGQIHQLTGSPNSIVSHTRESSRNPTWKGADISNNTAIGVEVIAKNDADVTQAQIEATARLARWLSQQPFANEDFAVVGHGAYQGGPGAAGRYGRSGKQADEGKRAADYYNSLSDAKKAQIDAFLAGQIGGDVDIDTSVVDGFMEAALTDEEAQAYLQQQGYSQTEEGAWTDGAQTFDDPMEAVKSLPLIDQLRLWIAANRGSVAPPEGRSSYDRGSDNPFLNDWLAQNSILNGIFGNTNDNTGGGSGSGSGSGTGGSGSGSGGAGGTGGGTGSGNGSGVGTGGPPTFDPPPGWDPRNLGLLYRPYSNPFTTNPFGPARNPWLAA